MDNFPHALRVIRELEGGVSDHKNDPGGLTKWGISLRFLRAIGADINGDGIVDGQDVTALTEGDVKRFYHEHFWVPCSCSDLPAGLDLLVFDSAVNQGKARASRLLQRAINDRMRYGALKVDGIVGKKTVAMARRYAGRQTMRHFMVRRTLHYSSLRNFTVFGRGWLSRVFRVYEDALRLAGMVDTT